MDLQNILKKQDTLEQDTHYNMLIEAPYKTGDIVSLKLITGEELIARLEKEEADKIQLSKPFALVPGQAGLGMMPWVLSVSPDSKITINMSTVILLHKTEEGISKQYVEQTTGLTMITK